MFNNDNNDPGAGPVNPNAYDPNNPPPGMRWDPTQNTFVPIGPTTTTPTPIDYTDPAVRALYGDPNGPYPAGSTMPGATPTPGPTGPTGPGPGPTTTGGGGTGPGSLIAPFTTPFTPPAQQPLPQLGTFTPPAFPNIPKFTGPTMQEAMGDPGYQFTYQQGQDALKNWEAAHGTFNDSSAAKALTDYGQNAASTQYQNVWNRDAQAYDRNTQTQYLDPYAAQYQGWLSGTVQPQTTAFTTGTQATLHQNDMNWQNSWNKWLQDFNIFTDQRNSTFNKQLAVA